MKLYEHVPNMHSLAEKLDELRLAQESLSFCRTVFEDYTVWCRPPNEHMDADKATAQHLGCY
jgi:hypothetical protein